MDGQRGDEGALFAEYNDELERNIARAVNTSAANVEDACAIAWAKFLRYQPDRERSWKGWLHHVAKREAWRLHRRDIEVSRYASFGDPEAREPWEPQDPRTGFEQIRLEAHDALALLSRVPARRREAAVLHLVGLKYAEIAEVLGLSMTRVDHLLREARAHLHAQIDAERPPADPNERPRVARLAELEREPPQWLTQIVGRPPRAMDPRVVLAWRRAALAVEDYRTTTGTHLRDGLGPRPLDLGAAALFDRAEDLVDRLREARQRERGVHLDR